MQKKEVAWGYYVGECFKKCLAGAGGHGQKRRWLATRALQKGARITQRGKLKEYGLHALKGG